MATKTNFADDIHYVRRGDDTTLCVRPALDAAIRHTDDTRLVSCPDCVAHLWARHYAIGAGIDTRQVEGRIKAMAKGGS